MARGVPTSISTMKAELERQFIGILDGTIRPEDAKRQSEHAARRRRAHEAKEGVPPPDPAFLDELESFQAEFAWLAGAASEGKIGRTLARARLHAAFDRVAAYLPERL